MREARDARKAGALDLAENKVKTALKMDPNEANAISALADIQADRGLSGEAAATYRRALSIEPLNGSALEGLLALYRRQGMTQAQHFISQLSPAQRNELRQSITRMDVAMVEAQADDSDALLSAMDSIPVDRRTVEISHAWGQQLENLAASHARSGRRDEAERLLQEAETIAGESDEESNLAIATAWGSLKEYEQADRIFDRLRTAHTPPSSRWYLRHAQYLAMQGSPNLAAELEAIAALPSLSPDEKQELYALQESLAIRTADAQLAANEPGLAHQTLAPLLKASPDRVPLLLVEARAYRAEEQWAPAQTTYVHVLRLEPDESEALRGLIETHLAAGDRTAALAQLDKWAAAGISSNPYNNMKQIDLYLELDEPDRAHEILDALMAQYPNEPNVLNRAWEVAQYEGRLNNEIVYLQKSLAAEEAERAKVLPAAQARVEPKPYQEYGFDELGSPKKIQRDWKEKKLATLIDRRSPWFSSAIDMRTSGGTPGLSESTFMEMPLEYKTAWHEDDEVFFRADVVKLDVGGVNPTRDNFGKMFLCQPNCSPALLTQNAQGAGFTVGYQRDDLNADIGVTPLNFPVSNIVGGIIRRGDLGDFGYSVEASRRPINTSLLAYAGTRDPATGEIWGGVVKTGARLGLSHFKPENLFVFWSTLDLHKLTGRNVIANNRFQVMAGGQWRFINEDNRLFSLGLSGRYTHHTRNAGEYTFGHGGYYSPQNARSVSLSGAYGERFPRLSYVLRGSVSASQSQTQSADYFPTDSLLQQQAAAIGPTYAGGSGTVGLGYSAEAAWEYQVDQQLFVGGVLSVERADYYSPNRALLYLRYSLEHPAAQPVYFTPEPVEPSSEF
jgi:tetratricopeptide (TPR) repeat protein